MLCIRRAILLVGAVLTFAGGATPAIASPADEGPNVDYQRIADAIVRSLALEEGERVLIRYDPAYMQELVGPLRRGIREAGAIDVGALEYAEMAAAGDADSEGHESAFLQLLDAVDVYLFLPVRLPERSLYSAEWRALGRWNDKGGTRRQLHFHWQDGSLLADGVTPRPSPAFDRIYMDALDIDYEALSAQQDRAIARLQAGTVRVRTPAGTDITFRLGDRPVCKQDGDASAARARRARTRIDRDIELPAGVIRVAPVEETVNGTLVIPEAAFGDEVARNVRLEIEGGIVKRVQAEENLPAVESELQAGGEAARRFREFGLGFNPRLVSPPDSPAIAYFGYGAGVVRLSLGDNKELGGQVRGGFVRWFFFPDATVDVEGEILVQNGTLVAP
jgi:hypothetical protein